MSLFCRCCNDSELLDKLAYFAAFLGNHLILEQMKHKFKVLPLESLLTQAINSDSPESVAVVHEMMVKNRMNVTWFMILLAQLRGVKKIIEILTGEPYDAEHEKKKVRLSILSGEDKTIAGNMEIK